MRKITAIVLALLVFVAASAPASASGEIAFSLSGAECSPGERVSLSVSVQNNTGFSGFAFNILYDPGFLTPDSITKSGGFGGQFISNKDYNETTVRVIYADAINYAGNGELFTITFVAASNLSASVTTHVGLVLDFLGNEDLQRISGGATAGSVKITVSDGGAGPTEPPVKPPDGGTGGGIVYDGKDKDEGKGEESEENSPSEDISDNDNETIDESDTPLATSLPFIDVKESDWFYKAVADVYEARLFNGTSADKFSPSLSMTRAMFVQVLANLENAPVSGYSQSPFSDVSVSIWYAKPIAWAYDVGLISGVGNGKFEPERAISREEMAVMLNNYIIWKGIELRTEAKAQFGDFGEVSSWAREAVSGIQSYGIISGVGDNIFAPKRIATRAEVAQIFANFLDVKRWA